MCALLTSAGGGLSGTWTPPVGFWARRLILEFENRPILGDWLGVWDELRNFLVTAA